MNGGHGCTTIWICLMPLTCTPKKVKIAHFMLGVFTTVKKKLREGKKKKGEDYLTSLQGKAL